MIPANQYVMIAKGLLEKTKQGKMSWKANELEEPRAAPATSFQFRLLNRQYVWDFILQGQVVTSCS